MSPQVANFVLTTDIPYLTGKSNSKRMSHCAGAQIMYIHKWLLMNRVSQLYPQFFLTHIEFDVFVCDGLDVETNGWNGGDGLIQLEFV
jgi:hypothetical protein